MKNFILIIALSFISVCGFSQNKAARFQNVTLTATPISGNFEPDGTNAYFTINGVRYALVVIVPSDATDADFTIVINSAKYLPAATLTANRTITFPTGSNGDVIEIYNNNATAFNWLLAGGSVYLSDGSTVVTQLLSNTNYIIRKISGKWRISN